MLLAVFHKDTILLSGIKPSDLPFEYFVGGIICNNRVQVTLVTFQRTDVKGHLINT